MSEAQEVKFWVCPGCEASFMGHSADKAEFYCSWCNITVKIERGNLITSDD